MSKFFLFTFLWYLLGSPFLAFLAMLAILYVLDRRFLGLSPSLVRPFRRARTLSRLRQELRMNPHHTSAKLEAARILIEKKKYDEGLELLQQTEGTMSESAEVLVDLGLCHLKQGRLGEGEAYMRKALELNPRVRYGEPYLRLGEAFAEKEPVKAIRDLERFREVHSSSCEAYYRLGLLHKKLGNPEAAQSAFRECREIYRGLPKYKRKTERKWVLLAMLQR